MSEIDKNWKKITTLYLNLKQVILFGEEFGNDFNTLLQPVMEQKHALDHIIRAEAVRNGQSKKKDEEKYILSQLEKAIGHLYRAFFDAADWSGMLIRDKVVDILEEYPSHCIDKVIPKYYPEFRPKIESNTEKIAELRGGKDVEKGGDDLLSEVEKYKNVLDELYSIYKEISSKISSLQDYYSKERKKLKQERNRNWLFIASISIVCAILGALLASAFSS